MGVSRKQSTPNFSKNEHFLAPDKSGDKKCLFFRKFGVLCFLETPVLRLALLPYYRRFVSPKLCQNSFYRKLKTSQSVDAKHFFNWSKITDTG